MTVTAKASISNARTQPLKATLLVLALLALVPQLIRLISILRFPYLQNVVGIEGTQFYNLWRFVNGYPLYVDPWNAPFTVTLYNFGFYWVYGSLLRLLGVNDQGIIPVARMITLLFSFVGVAASTSFVLIAAHHRKRQTIVVVAVTVSAIAWMGLNSTVWATMCARPDIASCSLALLGCSLYARVIKSGGYCILLLAGLSFAVAWTLKQSTVFTFVSCVGFALLFRRSIKETLYLTVPIAATICGAVVFASKDFWTNILIAPSLDRLSIAHAIQQSAEMIVPNVAFYAIPVIALLGGSFRRESGAGWGSSRQPTIQLLFFVSAVTLALGLVSIGREGAGRNHLFESVFSVSVLSAICIITSIEKGAQGRLSNLMLGSVLVMFVLPLFTLLFPNLN